jgi:hypothetical protein
VQLRTCIHAALSSKPTASAPIVSLYTPAWLWRNVNGAARTGFYTAVAALYTDTSFEGDGGFFIFRKTNSPAKTYFGTASAARAFFGNDRRRLPIKKRLPFGLIHNNLPKTGRQPPPFSGYAPPLKRTFARKHL